MKKLSAEKMASTVHSLRKSKGITQIQLSDATGINRAMISKLEKMDYSPFVSIASEIS